MSRGHVYDGDQRTSPGRRASDAAPEPVIKTVHVWLGVLMICATVVITGWQTAVSVGERAGEGNATLRQIVGSVSELTQTMKTVVEEQQQIRMDVQRLDNTTVKYDNTPQPRTTPKFNEWPSTRRK
jgi:hypothetical protein